ncbi:MAG: DUF5658 family protein [Thermoleophilia bacterium]
MTNLKASILLYLLLCVQAADWGTTVWIMSFGGVEANPIMAPLFALSPWVAILPKLAIVAGVTLLYLAARKQDRPLVMWGVAASVLVSMPPVVWNLIQLWNAGLI